MSFFNIFSCFVILIFGIWVFWDLKRVHKDLEKILASFKDIREEDNSGYTEELGEEGDILIHDPVKVHYSRTKLEDARNRYNEIYAEYASRVQMIPIFPLLGILGTVAGLVFSDLTDVSALVSGLSTALGTTFWGLICSIGLKFFDAKYPGMLLYRVDAEFAKADSAITRQTLREEVRRAKEEVREGLPDSKDAAK